MKREIEKFPYGTSSAVSEIESKENFMVGYPITYGDHLENGRGLTSETVLSGISEYWSNEENHTDFIKGYRFGLLVFSFSSILLRSTPVFASDNGMAPGNMGSCPEAGSPPSETPVPSPGHTNPGGLANVPTTDRGAYGASALGICGIAMKSGAYWVGFVCAAAVIVGVRMAAIPANAPL